jgi:indolepyruvate ferredoxin oxidoreductase beta subunit
LNNQSYTIVITGLGGQGLIRFIRILGFSLVRKGYKVITSEKHGLSQRGGKVICFLRFGEKSMAPIPLIGSADMIIATEKACIIDVLEFSKPNRSPKLVYTDYAKNSQNNDYPSEEYLFKVLNEISEFVYLVPVMGIVEKLTNLKIINSILLGYVLKFLPVNKEDLKDSIKEHFKGEALNLNLKALAEGISIK